MPLSTTYSLSFLTLDSAQVNVSGIVEAFPSGAQWDWYLYENPTLTVSTDATVQTVEVADSDGVLQDDAWLLQQQKLASDVCDADGNVIWPAGTVIEDEYEITLTGSDGGTYHMVAISIDTQIVGFCFEGDLPPAGTELTYVHCSYRDLQSLDPNNAVACFAEDTWIATARGDRLVHELAPGDMILTRDDGIQPLRWVASRTLTGADLAPNLRPIRIARGALGPATPRTPLRLSPQHRVLVRSRIALRMFGQPEILVAAKHLTALPGIDIDTDCAQVSYYHLLFDRHHVIYSNGAPTESLFPDALHLLPRAAAREITTLLPELNTTPARLLAPGRRGRQLAQRHHRNGKSVIDRPSATG